MVFWMIGDLAGTPLRILPWIVLGGALAYALRNARAMNVLALHAEPRARSASSVGAVRKGLFFVSGRADRERGDECGARSASSA
jgi:iron complex transport system permease protein